jgi:hypothetical protein
MWEKESLLLTKALVLVGLGIMVYLGLGQTPRVLEQGIRRYLQSTFPGSKVHVWISAPRLWFQSGNLDRVRVRMSQFDASSFPIPVAGIQSPGHGPRVTPSATSTTPSMPGPSATPGTPAAPPASPETGVASPAPGSSAPQPRNAPTPATHWAKIRTIDISLLDFHYVGMHIESFTATMPDILYDFDLARKKHMLRLGGSGVGSVQVLLSEADLNAGFRIESPDIRSFRIHLEQGRVRVTLEYHTPVAWVPVSAAAQLMVVEGHAIDLVSPTISAVGVTLPQVATDFILKRLKNINPVFDLDTLNLPLYASLSDIQTTPAGVTVSGVVQAPQVMNVGVLQGPSM